MKEFLLGLKTNRGNDIEEMKGFMTFGYNRQQESFKNFANTVELVADSVRLHQKVLLSETHLLINNGRFEGFKASGKMNTIGNMELRNSILDLCQKNLIGLTNATARQLSLKREMNKGIMELRKYTRPAWIT